MLIKDTLATQFFNYGKDKYEKPETTDAAQYHRVKGSWNVYYHGFMDEYCDIAYVKEPTSLEPGIYLIETYGVEAYLFFWFSDDRFRGLITRRDDEKMTEDAYAKYLKEVSSL